ncbi:SPFH domain-containing protein [Aliarcobacter cryaerophilus]|uniref:SPFH domain-containing protein n=1 Tax=Aliarcobacter cryaerophilus TaxID=28198 RepID=UPI0021B60CA2|nr:SPFH domain-containing protein [Aliarcobacter cryaerophilus]MCT7540269.1 SPFH domain-containing protein [Aliarcobacter cryaerophilus]
MAVIDLVKWNGSPDIFVWKYPSEDLSTWTQLIVNETQQAYLVRGGVYHGPFNAGRHTLSTENIPLLTSIIGLPFGGKSPFSAEIWYVNNVANLDIKWGTPDPIQLQDPLYGVMLPVRAFGQYGIKVSDGKKFLLKLVGTKEEFSFIQISDYFKGIFITKIKSEISKAIINNKRSVLDISTDLELISNTIKNILAPEMDDYGIELTHFNINSINIPEDDPAVISLKKTLSKRTEMNLLGFNYQQERSFDVMQSAAQNEGESGSVMGMGMGMGMGIGMGVPMGNVFGEMASKMQTSNTTSCSKCSKSIPSDSTFCPECGNNTTINNQNYKKCPICSLSVPASSNFCLECGAKMIPTCSNCKNEIILGTKFCQHCGEKQ